MRSSVLNLYIEKLEELDRLNERIREVEVYVPQYEGNKNTIAWLRGMDCKIILFLSQKKKREPMIIIRYLSSTH